LSPAVAAPIVRTLRERALAGVDVRIVYDAGKPGVRLPAGISPPSPATGAFLTQLGPEIGAKAITGGHAHVLKLMHHKYIVKDGKTPAGSVWTGSTNFTEDSWTLQENNILRLDSPELCNYYERDFDELWARGDIDQTGARDHGIAPVGGAMVSVAFSPGDGPTIDHHIARRISAARRRLKICSMIITSGGILGALGDALHHGDVRDYGGIYDRTQMEGVFDQWKDQPVKWKIGAFEEIARGLAGKRSTPYSASSRHDFMHNKVVVADDTVITGSFNLSHSATENAENVLMITDAELAERYNGYIDSLVRRYMNG
jgi:phosphatidylserine/phosphatidylglycerophosphate/cardiolipin synthase-like enzyme